MEQQKLDRINELAKLAKTRELSAEEAEERAKLRAEYLASWKHGLEQALKNVRIDDGEGNLSKLHKKE